MSFAANEIISLIEASLKKSQIWANDSFVYSVDANGDAVLSVSEDATPATTERVAVIRVKADDIRAAGTAAFTGAANLAIPQARPSIIEIATEAAALSSAELLDLSSCLAPLGTKERYFERAAGAAPATSDMTAANLILEKRGNQFISGISQ